MKYRSHLRLFVFCVCTLVTTAGVRAQGGAATQGQQGTDRDTVPKNRSDRETSSTTSATDTRDSFINQAMEINSAEIQLGRIAAAKAQNDRVKSFAEMMVKDHTDALEKFRHPFGRSRRRRHVARAQLNERDPDEIHKCNPAVRLDVYCDQRSTRARRVLL